jgi:hypothetical protein
MLHCTCCQSCRYSVLLYDADILLHSFATTEIKHVSNLQPPTVSYIIWKRQVERMHIGYTNSQKTSKVVNTVGKYAYVGADGNISVR